MAKVVLLSCTKSKTKHAAPAQELYSASPMFQKTLEYGKSLKPDKMYILSAKHHLVPLTKTLEPYDKTLKEMPKAEKEQFVFLTGSEYMKLFTQYIPDGNIEKPMEGKRFGERLKWLNSQVQKLSEAFKRLKNLIYEALKK